MTRVVDTNVLLVTKYRDDWPPELVDACDELLEQILEGSRPVVTDAEGEILDEYLHELDLSGSPSLGHAFVKYVHDYLYTWDESYRPSIDPHPDVEYSYGVLGGDDADIDASDRKFVATAKVAGVPISEATDTKWLDWGPVLARHGVVVEFVHEAAIRALYLAKFGREAP